MMKNILIVFSVLAMASVANAGFMISVDGVIDPADSDITLKNPSDTAVIDIHGAGNVLGTTVTGWLLLQGNATINGSPSFVWANSTSANMDAATFNDMKPLLEGDPYNYVGLIDIVSMDIMDIVEPLTVPNGLLIDGILLHCEGRGDVTLTLLDAGTWDAMDSVTIHQIPEPITLALLGLGGLFLRRRK
jgi:hypothetical protein